MSKVVKIGWYLCRKVIGKRIINLKNTLVMSRKTCLAMNLPLYVINKMMEIKGRNPQCYEYSDLDLLMEAEKELGWDY